MGVSIQADRHTSRHQPGCQGGDDTDGFLYQRILLHNSCVLHVKNNRQIQICGGVKLIDKGGACPHGCFPVDPVHGIRGLVFPDSRKLKGIRKQMVLYQPGARNCCCNNGKTSGIHLGRIDIKHRVLPEILIPEGAVKEIACFDIGFLQRVTAPFFCGEGQGSCDLLVKQKGKDIPLVSTVCDAAV